MTEKCYICTTPYQVIAAISMLMEHGDEADLVVVPQFVKAAEYVDRIKHANVFKEVILVDTTKIEAYKRRKSKSLFGLGIVWNYVRLGSIVRSIVGDKQYTSIYISSQANIGRLISLYYMKHGAEIILFDDGEGSYDNDKIYKAQGIDSFIRRIIFGKKAIELGTKRRLYSPDLYRSIYGAKDDVERINAWTGDSSTLELINYICGYSQEARIQEKAVFLDTIVEEAFGSKAADEYNKMLEIIINSFGDDLIIKKHPRDLNQKGTTTKVYQYQEIPFEVICANSAIEDKVLITAASTAVLMPKIMFDQEPVIIWLYQLLSKKEMTQKRQRFLSSVKKLYREENRFLIPQSLDELESMLQEVLAKYGE